MQRLAILLVVPVLAACGASADEAAPPAPAAFAALVGAAAEPAGTLRSADGSAAFFVRAGRLVRVDRRTGAETAAYPLPGRWALASVSASGRWVALTRPGTRVLVVDGETGKVAHSLRLPGRFVVEAVSAQGDFLFLQQNLVGGGYAVRGYDLFAGELIPGSLGQKGQTVVMQGEAGQVVASPDGRWLLTLYVETASNTAFVHALDLVDRNPTCIPLPPCERCAPGDWTLALAANGRTLRATNARGTTEFDLARY